jgi:hypothetical protein
MLLATLLVSRIITVDSAYLNTFKGLGKNCFVRSTRSCVPGIMARMAMPGKS